MAKIIIFFLNNEIIFIKKCEKKNIIDKYIK